MGFLIMSITNARKRHLKWEIIDVSFNLMEYYEELRFEELTDEERMYMRKTISSLARKLQIDNHISII